MCLLGTSTENRTRVKLYQARRQGNAETSTQSLLKHRYIYGGGETGTLWEIHQKYVKISKVWCWRRMEISWTDRVKNEEVLLM